MCVTPIKLLPHGTRWTHRRDIIFAYAEFHHARTECERTTDRFDR